MKYEEYFVLHILNQFNGERSVSAIYHLLRGKKSSQTIQDGFLFKVHPYFQSLPYITRQNLNEIIVTIEKENMIGKKDTDHFVLTTEGKKQLDEWKKIYTIPEGLNGWFYGGIAAAFWKHLNLLVQTLSYLHEGESRFIPITRDESTLKWVKEFLLSLRIQKRELLNGLYYELESVLDKLPDLESQLIVHRLSGFRCNGLSLPQLSDMTGKSPYEISLLLLSGLQRTAKMINEGKDYQLLKQLIEKDKGIGLTDSARKTLIMIKSGQTVEEIARYRHLKVTTIQDHIVETAFCDPSFSIAPFVDEGIYNAIVQALAKTKTRKLSTIKQYCSDDVQYFHIRLVLARERIT